MSPSPEELDVRVINGPPKHVICIYNKDYTDIKQVSNMASVYTSSTDINQVSNMAPVYNYTRTKYGHQAG